MRGDQPQRGSGPGMFGPTRGAEREDKWRQRPSQQVEEEEDWDASPSGPIRPGANSTFRPKETSHVDSNRSDYDQVK